MRKLDMTANRMAPGVRQGPRLFHISNQLLAVYTLTRRHSLPGGTPSGQPVRALAELAAAREMGATRVTAISSARTLGSRSLLSVATRRRRTNGW